MISRHKTPQNTARIDRTAHNVAFYRTFLRAVLYPAIARRRKVIDRSYNYRPLIGRVGMWRFADVSAS
jgi:hypothetical protein